MSRQLIELQLSAVRAHFFSISIVIMMMIIIMSIIITSYFIIIIIIRCISISISSSISIIINSIIMYIIIIVIIMMVLLAAAEARREVQGGQPQRRAGPGWPGRTSERFVRLGSSFCRKGFASIVRDFRPLLIYECHDYFYIQGR